MRTNYVCSCCATFDKWDINIAVSRKYDLQQAPDNPDYGLLAVKAFFIDNVLRVEVLNARGIKSSDPDSECSTTQTAFTYSFLSLFQPKLM